MEEGRLADDMILDAESPVNTRINSWVQQHCIIDAQKSTVVFSTWAMKTQEIEIKKPLTLPSKNIKYWKTICELHTLKITKQDWDNFAKKLK